MVKRFTVFAVAAVAVLAISAGVAMLTREPDLTRDELLTMARAVFVVNSSARRQALDAIRERGDDDMVAVLVMALRFIRDTDFEIGANLAVLTGEQYSSDWPQWMIWQETHPEVEPFDGFDELKSELLASVDRRYLDFLYPGVAHDIRLEEIVWGGVPARDGIPSLDYPEQIPAGEADYLNPEDLVFGISIDGDTRAYPLRIMDWHEMFNDTVGGVDLALAYCTLCGSGILYESRLAGRDAPIVFGSSGLLYRSNKLMYDHETNSLWNQFTGRPVVGELTGSGLELVSRPVVITSWENWRDAHPETSVLSLETGHNRDYSPGAVYGDYFASPGLMFPVAPAAAADQRLAEKDYVFGLTVPGARKAWPLSVFEGGVVLMDEVEGLPVVLIGDAATRTVRAYEAAELSFTRVEGRDDVVAAGATNWAITEAALVGPEGRRLARLAGHIAYWFGWQGFRGETSLYEAP